MWTLFKKMILAIGGSNEDNDLGFAFECLPHATKTIQHFIQKDPVTFMSKSDPKQVLNHGDYTLKLVRKILLAHHEGFE
jgi:hypothetical protein